MSFDEKIIAQRFKMEFREFSNGSHCGVKTKRKLNMNSFRFRLNKEENSKKNPFKSFSPSS